MTRFGRPSNKLWYHGERGEQRVIAASATDRLRIGAKAAKIMTTAMTSDQPSSSSRPTSLPTCGESNQIPHTYTKTHPEMATATASNDLRRTSTQSNPQIPHSIRADNGGSAQIGRRHAPAQDDPRHPCHRPRPWPKEDCASASALPYPRRDDLKNVRSVGRAVASAGPASDQDARAAACRSPVARAARGRSRFPSPPPGRAHIPCLCATLAPCTAPGHVYGSRRGDVAAAVRVRVGVWLGCHFEWSLGGDDPTFGV